MLYTLFRARSDEQGFLPNSLNTTIFPGSEDIAHSRICSDCVFEIRLNDSYYDFCMLYTLLRARSDEQGFLPNSFNTTIFPGSEDIAHSGIALIVPLKYA